MNRLVARIRRPHNLIRACHSLMLCTLCVYGLIVCFGMQAWALGIVQMPSSGGTTVNINLATAYSVPRNAAVGTVVASIGQNYGFKVIGVTCNVTKTATVSGTLVSGLPGVYATSIPGIGIRYKTTSNYNGSIEVEPSTTTYSVPTGTATTSWYIYAELVVTGPVSPGAMAYAASLSLTFSGSCFTPLSTVQGIGATPVPVFTVITCIPNNAAIVVTLPSVQAPSLSTLGTTAGSKAFSIPFTCSAGTNVYITITDAINPGNTTALLSLAPGSTAQGVALQILFGSAVVSYGPDSAAAGTLNQFFVGISDTLTSVPLTVRYISTGPVVPGLIIALATFTMSYQ